LKPPGRWSELKRYVLPKGYPELVFLMQIYIVEAGSTLLGAMSSKSECKKIS